MINESKKPVLKKPKTKIINEVKDYGNDHYFVEKAKESKEFLERHGFPKELLIKK